MMSEIEKWVKNEALPGYFHLGDVGHFPLSLASFRSLYNQHCISDEIMDAMFYLKGKHDQTCVLTSHVMTNILEGTKRARSTYFVKNNILHSSRYIMGPYLENGNHWTFVHFDLTSKVITYANSLGESTDKMSAIKDNWGKFAEARQTTGPWTIKSFKHAKQMDSVSCGVFTIMFAECHLSVSPFRDCCLFTKRQQLTQELWAALDRTKRCGSCVKLLHGKGVKCGTCSGHCHTMCLQKKGLCFLCAYDSDVVQVDNTEEVVVVEKATYTQMDDSDVVQVDNTEEVVVVEKATYTQMDDSDVVQVDNTEEVVVVEKATYTQMDDSDVVQVDNTEEVVVMENATYTQMEAETTEEGVADGGLAQESAAAEGEQVLFEVESVLRISDGTKAKRYTVTREELFRRCGSPECYSSNALVAYLRKGKSQKEVLVAKLHKLEVKPGPRIKLSTSVSKLCEEECVTLSEDLNYLAAKFLPITKISQTCLEEGDGLHEAIAKTENCRKTLGHLLTTMEANWQDYGLATHGLGPQMLKGTFALIDTCLAKKIEILKTQK
ncbi:uncharacterized protein LOC118562251 isoform X2 [Fundulus heteroclitus]|uniref:uncharacterized protein LOC118557850 isoform X2 n=1 Tax=Fundulus heteroclitus TaxID=8078 RepID=UPI00165C5DBF|nr:uncharacterized protein LOC118557850 isoform X2 [Fundulus heteroclitus]XP_035990405.1 uncharacterized protein LOC118562251 isoform X2 [Fundulus heteroclitus]XP_035990406.1 uncharacterized protein LOC118562251 isoform X2 [Fundulus heteroclitus]